MKLIKYAFIDFVTYFKLTKFSISLVFLLSFLIIPSIADSAKRRKDSFATGKAAEGYYIAPAPYNLEGVGGGFAIAGSITNFAGNYQDITGYYLHGAISGFGIAMTEYHILEEYLITDIFISSLSEFKANAYSSRGMNSDDEKYKIIGIKDIATKLFRLTKTQPNRRYETSMTYITSSGTLDKLYDKNGNLIQELDNSFNDGSSISIGFRLDLSDEYQDPRDGLVNKISTYKSLNNSSFAADYYLIENDFAYYFPMREIDTLVVNLFLSRSFVLKEGLLDKEQIALTNGCANVESCQEIVNDSYASNKYGTAASLGGRNRLRAYPQQRFQGSQTIFFGTEYRLNFSEKLKFFDIFIAKGTKSNLQVAFFAEFAVTGDKTDKLFDKFKDTFGAGFRLVLSSGFVFRADYGMSSDTKNSAMTVIVGYPWDSF